MSEKSAKSIETKKHTKALYTLGEELVNAISHGLGALLAVAGTIILIVASVGDVWKVVSCAIYGASMILLFTMSCLYHAISHVKAKKVMRVFDHTTIFILIAGTYTPFTLVTLRGWIGWTLFGVVWGAAIIGITFTAINMERFKVFSMVCYIASGWCVVLAAVPMIRTMALPGLLLLLAGGVVYTLGLIFYAKKIRYCHGIWHFFVLGGAILHYFCILFYVVGV